MRALPGVFSVAFGLYALGCAPEVEVATVSLELARVASCAEAELEALRVRATGDFPALSERFELDAPAPLDAFPTRTRELVLSGQAGDAQIFGQLAMRSARSAQPVLLLPLERSCPLGDPLALALPGALVHALSAGGALIAGGHDETGSAVSSALLLPASAALVRQVEEGMLLRRAHASATETHGLVLVAGGTADMGSSAHDTTELFDPASGRFARERSRKLQGGGRMEHGAVRLPDSRVLLVGGRSRALGAPLGTAELIDVESGEQLVVSGAAGLAQPRVSPAVLRLDSGAVVVAGGHDARGVALRTVERFDPRQARFLSLTSEDGEAELLPARRELAIGALPGARLAAVGCDDTGPCELAVLQVEEAELRLLPSALDFSAAVPNGLVEARLLVLADGRLLVTGRDPVAPVARRALVVDLNEETVAVREASRVPSSLALLPDGSVLELDAFGASLRREHARSRYDTPEQSLTTARQWLALDAKAHWRAEAKALVARVPDARLTVPHLLFSDFRLALAARGSLRLLLVADEGELAPRFGGTASGFGECAAERLRADALVLVRRGSRVELESSGSRPACELGRLEGQAQLALEADQDTSLRELRLTRLRTQD